MMAVWIFVKALLGRMFAFMTSVVKTFVRWFLGLSPVGQVAFGAGLSLLLNVYQWHLLGKARIEVETAKTACAKQRLEEEKAGNKIHDDRQTMLDFLTTQAKLDTDRQLNVIHDKVIETKVIYEKVSAATPLPAGCKYDAARLQAANQAIRQLSTPPVRHE